MARKSKFSPVEKERAVRMVFEQEGRYGSRWRYDHLPDVVVEDLQDRNLHRTQHEFDDFGRKNAERP